jgi:signal transduction histidine kinase
MHSNPKIVLEEQRRRVLLRPLLFAAFALSITAVIIIITSLVSSGRSVAGYFFGNAGLLLLGITPILFATLAYLTSRGKLYTSAIGVVLLLAVFSIITVARYGILTPQGVISMLLTILIAGATLSILLTTILTILLSTAYTVIFYLHSSGIISLAATWSSSDTSMGDVAMTIISFGVTLFTVVIFQRETNNALDQALQSEAALRAERDSLEVTVAKRTDALRESQYNRILELSKFADLGRHSAALMHDLVNHLNALRLNLDVAASESDSTSKQVHESLTRASHSATVMEHFIQSIRRDMQAQTSISTFDAYKEIKDVIASLSYRQRMYQVAISFTRTKPLVITTDQIKFFRICQNLIANAIDSYEHIADGRKRVVQVSLTEAEKITLTVQDNGCGMSSEQVARVYEPFYTTKGITSGTGIGMTIVHELVTQSLRGTINITSNIDAGTSVVIDFPLKLKHDEV